MDSVDCVFSMSVRRLVEQKVRSLKMTSLTWKRLVIWLRIIIYADIDICAFANEVRWDSAHCDFFVLMAPGITTLTNLLINWNLTRVSGLLCLWQKGSTAFRSFKVNIEVYVESATFCDWLQLFVRMKIAIVGDGLICYILLNGVGSAKLCFACCSLFWSCEAVSRAQTTGIGVIFNIL